jgi:PAS domain S-box-containing protein
MTAIAVGNFTLCLAGLIWRSKTAGVSPVWPAAGLALFAVVRVGYPALLPLLVSKIAANMVFGDPWALAIIPNLADPLKAVVGAYMLRRFGVATCQLISVRQVARFLIACVALGATGAGLGMAGLAAMHVSLSTHDGLAWLAGDSLGAALVAPVFFYGRALWQTRSRNDGWWGYLAGFAGAMVGACAILFRNVPTALSVGFLSLPLLYWGAIRLRAAGAVVLNVVFAIAALGFLGPQIHENVLFVVALLAVGAGASLCYAALAEERASHLASILNDITERQRAEALLRASEERFRSLIENATDLITLVNRTGEILFQSPSSERVLGLPSLEIIGHNICELVHPEDRSTVIDAIAEILRIPGRSMGISLRLQHRDSSWRRFDAVGKCMNGDGAGMLIVFNARDITDRLVVEEQLRQSQKMEAVGRLSGGVAHDFNNLLTVIQGNASLMKSSERLTDALAEPLAEIQAAAARAAKLTNQLLAFSRRQTMQLREYDLAEVLGGMVHMLERLLSEDIRIEFHFSPQPQRVHADAAMLEQVLLNLAVNARDAMPDGGRIAVSTFAVDFDESSISQTPHARVGSFACLEVRDTGSGISQENLGLIFEPFFTTKPVGKGTGLGLATVYGIVQQHQGWINVDSELGKGTAFRIYLPRLVGLALVPEVPVSLDTPTGGNETILLVEDESPVRAFANAALTRAGYRVYVAASGPEALELWAQRGREVDLVVTDVVMPGGLSGFALGERLTRERAGLRILYTSGYQPDLGENKIVLRDGVNFLAKPFDAEQLLRAVRAASDQPAQ